MALPPRPPFRLSLPGRVLRRRPAPFWLLAVALSLVTATTVARLVSEAEAAAARYGAVRPAVVATRHLPAGTVLAPGDAEVRSVPAAFLPPGALEAPVEGAVLSAAVVEGEPLVGERLAPAGTSPVAALLPPGTRGIAVPTGAGALPLSAGDVVDVLATVEPGLGDEPTFPVASAATVVDAGEDAVTIAVRVEEAPRVAFALGAGAVTLVLVGGLG